MKSLEEVLAVLKFYADGQSDGGDKAAELLRELKKDASAGAMTPSTASGSLIRIFSRAYQSVFRRPYETESGDHALLAAAIKKSGYIPIRDALPKIVGDWKTRGLGKCNINNSLRACAERLQPGLQKWR